MIEWVVLGAVCVAIVMTLTVPLWARAVEWLLSPIGRVWDWLDRLMDRNDSKGDQ